MRIVVIMAVALASLLVSCSKSGRSAEQNVGITDTEYCDKLRSYGAADAFINRSDGVFSYGVVEGAVTGSPDDVARLMYEDAYESGIRGVSECRVVELPTGKMLGRYKP